MRGHQATSQRVQDVINTRNLISNIRIFWQQRQSNIPVHDQWHEHVSWWVHQQHSTVFNMHVICKTVQSVTDTPLDTASVTRYTQRVLERVLVGLNAFTSLDSKAYKQLIKCIYRSIYVSFLTVSSMQAKFTLWTCYFRIRFEILNPGIAS